MDSIKRPYLHLNLGDVRSLVKDIGLDARNIRNKVLPAVEKKGKKLLKEMRRRTSQSTTTTRGVRKRSGGLKNSVTVDISPTDFTIKARLGFAFAMGRTISAARVLVGATENFDGVGTRIFPRHAKKLAFPPEDAPRDIRDSRGVQLMTAKQARATYKFTHITPKAIIGRKIGLGGRMGKERLLFIRKRSVYVKRRINLDELADKMVVTFEKEIDKLLS